MYLSICTKINLDLDNEQQSPFQPAEALLSNCGVDALAWLGILELQDDACKGTSPNSNSKHCLEAIWWHIKGK